MNSMTRSTTTDRELAAVLITLAPLGDRGRVFVDTERRTFDSTNMLDNGWSTGERWLILCAKALWTGRAEKIDLAYVATLDETFLLAVVNGIAAYRGGDFASDWAGAIERVTA